MSSQKAAEQKKKELRFQNLLFKLYATSGNFTIYMSNMNFIVN